MTRFGRVRENARSSELISQTVPPPPSVPHSLSLSLSHPLPPFPSHTLLPAEQPLEHTHTHNAQESVYLTVETFKIQNKLPTKQM